MKAKTTLTIDEQLMRRVKERAARDGTTMSNVVEKAIRRELEDSSDQPPRGVMVELPRFSMGEPLIDILDKEAMYEILDEDLNEKYRIRDAR